MSPEQLYFKQVLKKNLSGPAYLVGSDEVGRGALAGPVISCSVAIKADAQKFSKLEKYLRQLGVCDSKKLSLRKREEILNSLGVTKLRSDKKYSFKIFEELDIYYKIESINHHIVDEINVLQASLLSFKKSCEELFKSEKKFLSKSHMVFIDGKYLPEFELPIRAQAVIKGDQKSALIGLASIIAKIARDRHMLEMANEYPDYGFESHVGYPTAMHKEALKTHGPSPIHRMSYKPVAQICKKGI